MIYIILYNNELLFSKRDELNDFIEILEGEAFNKYSTNGIRIFKEYIYECFDAGEKLTAMVQERLDDSIVPIVCINTDECSDLNQITFMVMSTNEDREFSYRDEMIFNNSCDICFGQIKGFYDRLCQQA